MSFKIIDVDVLRMLGCGAQCFLW